MRGFLREIVIGESANALLNSVTQAEIEAGKGIVGDRYYVGEGTFSELLQGLPEVEITLIEQEEIDAFNAIAHTEFTAQDFRRNLVTTGIQLNDLVDVEFQVGSVTLKGIRLCEPCAHLAQSLGDEVMKHMLHKAGLRAQILSGGTISVNDEVIA